tara:strand:+ start:145 stop:396 length:252 start_codon:yes stop_codon:yes gene_type:complete
MDLLIIAFIAALGYLIILCKLFSPQFVAKTQVMWDVLFTIAVPILFLGTFSGMTTAFLSGVIFSAMTFVLSLCHTKRPKKTYI